MRKILLVFMLFIVFPFAVQAEGEFHNKFEVDYVFDELGESQITQKITLTNLMSQVYAAKYQFTTNGSIAGTISGHDSKGQLKITTEPREQNSTLVTVLFNDPVVGKGNSQQFELTYKGPAAVHNGQIWEIILPSLEKSIFIDEYILNLRTSPKLGKLAFITPEPKRSTEFSYTFTNDQLAKVGVVAAFGNFQTFGFQLKYQLENTETRPVFTEIALPQDTNYQRVFYDSVEPRPKNVRQDADGNWLARYDLAPNEKIAVLARGQAHLLAEPIKLFSDLAEKPDLQKYLLPTKYWPSTDPEMRKLGFQLKSPRAIYDYVANTLSYDLSQAKNPDRVRKDGKQALATPDKSVCLEFTDLFITLARAAGIPAREVNGYAYTNDSTLRPLSLIGDVLHAWPQYWDTAREMWISVDPTWGNTTGGVDYFSKLDFNHFAFVIHGLSDSEPIAAGLYKTSEKGKNIQVSFSQYKEYPTQDINITWKHPWQLLPLLNNLTSVTLANDQGQAIYHRNLTIEPKNFLLKSSPFSQTVVMPPYSHIEIPMTIARGGYLNFAPKSFKVHLNNQTMSYNISSRLYLAWHVGVGITTSLIIVGLAFVAARPGSLFFQKLKFENHLRGQGKGPPK